MPTRYKHVATLCFSALVIAGGVKAQGTERSGQQVVDQVCAACHRTGAHGAPKIGDRKAWANRASQGLSSLTQNALKGIREMPPHGGNFTLTDTEIERAITYMVNRSGGHWIEPVSRTKPAVERSGEQTVRVQCAKCHESGVSGAPRIDDRAAWAPRMTKGLDATVRSAIHGHGAMPARGGIADLSDTELRAAVLYMFYPAGASLKNAAPASAAPARDPHHRVVGGVEIDLGITLAESAAVEPKPSGKGYYYVSVSLHDAATKTEIKDAQVEARAANPVTGGDSGKLKPAMINNVTSYGGFFRMRGKEPYTITVQVRRSTSAAPVEAKFDFKP